METARRGGTADFAKGLKAQALQALVARQPILDAQKRVYAYELLYRNEGEDVARIRNGVQASSAVIINTFVDIGIDKVAGNYPVFINLPLAFLNEGHPIPFPADRVRIEVLEDVQPTVAVLNRLRQLSTDGYKIVLDDFVYRPGTDPLVELADYVKLDIRALSREQVAEHVKKLRNTRVKLIAEKVETEAELEFCKSLGIRLFQGYFFCRPVIVRVPRPSHNHVGLLRLLQQVQSPETDLASLKRLIAQDVSLSYRLLRCLNSASFGLQRPVSTVSQAVTLLGERKLRQWVTLVALSSMKDQPQELIIIAALRAGMCEVLGLARGDDSGIPFTVGLLSVLDAMLGIPMEEVLRELPVAEEISSGILKGEGKAGALLRCVTAYETGDWNPPLNAGFSAEELRKAWLTAVEWAEELRETLSS